MAKKFINDYLKTASLICLATGALYITSIISFACGYNYFNSKTKIPCIKINPSLQQIQKIQSKKNLESKLINYDIKDKNIERGNKELKQIALTFDYEAGKEGIEFILDTLKNEKIKATFFITGDMMEYHPDIIKRIVNEGYEYGNHTFYHKKLTELDDKCIKSELINADKLFNKITGKNFKYWRAPGGRITKRVLDIAVSCGYGPHFNWTFDTEDWKCRKGKEDEFKDNLFMQFESDDYKGNGAIILSHSYRTFYKKWPKIIQKLKEKNYQFVSLSDLMQGMNKNKQLAKLNNSNAAQ